MNLSISIPEKKIKKILQFIDRIRLLRLTIFVTIFLAIVSTAIAFNNDLIVAYGDAESHLNIAKRVIHGLTPGFAQLGGIWLPMPHILMIPFVYFDFLWRTGLAGSIVSGFAFIVSSIFLFKLTKLLTGNKYAAFFSSLVFVLNPNILYLQSTPMTELPLVAFFILSSYFFIKHIKNDKDLISLILAAFFGFCAVLTRYDGWFLVLFEAATIGLMYLRRRENFHKMEGKILLFSTLAFFGVFLWMMWDFLILGDPFYFTNSQFSARTQQENWLAKGELPAYRNIYLSFLYYFITSLSNAGIIIFSVFIISFLYYFIKERSKSNLFLALVLFAPF